MKKFIILFCFVLGCGLGVKAQTVYRISNNGSCVWVKNMSTGVGTCGKLEFSDKITYIELRFGSQVVSADISELKDDNGVSLGATNQAVVTALGLISQTSGGGGSGGGTVSLGANSPTKGLQDSTITELQLIKEQLLLVKAKTDNLDVLLSTRTKPLDVQKTDGSSVTQPISATDLPLPAGASTETTVNTLFKAGQNIGNTAFIANAGTNLNTSALNLETTQVSNGTKIDAVNTTAGTLFKAGQNIGNTSFGISGTLPAYATTPTFKIDQTTDGTTNKVFVGNQITGFATENTAQTIADNINNSQFDINGNAVLNGRGVIMGGKNGNDNSLFRYNYLVGDGEGIQDIAQTFGSLIFGVDENGKAKAFTFKGNDVNVRVNNDVGITDAGGLLATGQLQTDGNNTLINLDGRVFTLSNKFGTGLDIGNVGLKAGTNTIGNVNQTQATAGFTKLTNGTDDVTIKASSTASTATDKALVVDIRPQTALFGANTPTVTAITTAGNTITTANCIKILIENQSLTTNATVTYGGSVITLGYKGNTAGYSTFYAFDALYDIASRKYSPFATMVVDGSGSNVSLTKIFAQ